MTGGSAAHGRACESLHEAATIESSRLMTSDERVSWTAAITVLGVDIALVCDASSRAVIEPLVAPWLATPGSVASPTVRLTAAGAPGGGYTLQDTHRVVARAADERALAVAVQDWLDDVLIHAAAPLIPVHAGIVACANATVLLPGPSGTGKTRLVSALIDAGAAYGSDERAFLDDEGWAHAFPRQLVFRDAAGLRRCAPPPPRTAVVNGPLPVSLIVACEFVPQGQLELRPLGASEALLLLLANTPHRLNSEQGIPRPLVRVVAGAARFAGIRGESAAAADAILELLRRHEPA